MSLRVLQVGLGGWGTDWATTILPLLPEVHVVGRVDSSPEARAGFAAATGVPETELQADLAAALASTSAEAVLAPVAIGAHVEVAEQVLTAGKHLLLEKPFALDAATASRLAGLAADRGLVFAIDQNYRFFPAVPVVRTLLADGAVGRVRHARVHWHRNHEGVRRSNALLEVAIHHFDLMRLIFDSDAAAVTCAVGPTLETVTDRLSGAETIVELESGLVVGHGLTSEGVGAQTPWPGVWTISGDDGVLTWGRASYESDGDDHTYVSLTTSDGVETVQQVPELPLFERAGVLRSFVDAVRHGTAPSSPAADNVHSVAMLEAAFASARGAGRVEVRRG